MGANSEVVFLGGHEAWDRITDRVAAAKKSPVLTADLSKATANERTDWPKGFNPVAAGVTFK